MELHFKCILLLIRRVGASATALDCEWLFRGLLRVRSSHTTTFVFIIKFVVIHFLNVKSFSLYKMKKILQFINEIS